MRTIVAHRWSGGPKTDWYPWLAKELEKEGYEVVVPEMGDTEKPTIAEWVGNLSKAIGAPDENTVLVAHSIGCQTVMRFLEDAEQLVAGIVFVAPWLHLNCLKSKEAKDASRQWLETPIDFDAVRKNARRAIALFSDDDPCVPLSDKELFEQKLGAKTTVIKNAGHFTEDDGYTKFPQVLTATQNIIA